MYRRYYTIRGTERRCTVSDNFVRYNANARGRYVGDCVKRAMSLAFNKPYLQVEKDLNRVRKECNLTSFSYCSPFVFERLIKEYGAGNKQLLPCDYRITISNFAKGFNGTYLVDCCGRDEDRPTHIVCVTDHKVYDSWDSSEYVVWDYFKVSDQNLRNTNVIDVANYEGEKWVNLLVDRVTKGLSKCVVPYMLDKRYYLARSHSVVVSVRVNPKTKYLQPVTVNCYVSVSPFQSYKTFEREMTKEIENKVYTRTLAVRNDAKQVMKYLSNCADDYVPDNWCRSVVVSGDGNSLRAYRSLPAWIKPLVVEFRHNTWTGYYVKFKALPRFECRTIEFRADNKRSLNVMINTYRDTGQVLSQYDVLHMLSLEE